MFFFSIYHPPLARTNIPIGYPLLGPERYMPLLKIQGDQNWGWCQGWGSINLPVTVSPGAFVVSFCSVLNLENVPRRFRSITSPVKQVWLVVSIKNWIVLKLKKWEHRKKRENDLPCNSLDLDLKIWLSDPNNLRVLSTEILLWLQS